MDLPTLMGSNALLRLRNRPLTSMVISVGVTAICWSGSHEQR